MGGADETPADPPAFSREHLARLERAASLGKLAGVIAHEIRNPLGFVANFGALSEELLSELSEWLDGVADCLDASSREDAAELLEVLGENIARIREHAARADRVVDETLRSARANDRPAEPFELNAALERGVSWARQSATGSDAVLVDVQLDPSAGEIRGWPSELVRVFLNVLDNAYDAVLARREAEGEGFTPRIDVRSSADGAAVTVRIEDNGVGIDGAERAEVFEPFFTRKGVDEGTGLGLSLSRDIVERHGGEIGLESEKGAYTRLTITLPRDGGAG